MAGRFGIVGADRHIGAAVKDEGIVAIGGHRLQIGIPLHMDGAAAVRDNLQGVRAGLGAGSIDRLIGAIHVDGCAIG